VEVALLTRLFRHKQALVEPHFTGQGGLLFDPVDVAFDATRGVTAASLGIVATVQLDDLSSVVQYYTFAAYNIREQQAYFLTRRQAMEAFRRLLLKVGSLDVDLA
jgi:hypothetical protein